MKEKFYTEESAAIAIGKHVRTSVISTIRDAVSAIKKASPDAPGISWDVLERILTHIEELEVRIDKDN